MRIRQIVTKTLPSSEERGASAVAAALTLTLALLGAGAAAAQETTPPQAGANPAPEAKPPTAETKPQAPRNVEPIYRSEAVAVLGKQVQGPSGENFGRVVDLLVDTESRPRAAVIDFGGFLGVGSRKIVVDWNALHFGSVANKSDSITLELTKQQVSAAPEYKEDTPLIVLGAAGSLHPWDYDH